jgi:hypothetical protein
MAHPHLLPEYELGVQGANVFPHNLRRLPIDTSSLTIYCIANSIAELIPTMKY